MIKTKFFQTCMGLSIVFLSLGFFFHSIQSATASPGSDIPLQAETNTSHKYTISMCSHGESLYAIILNTESGVSEIYFYYNHLNPWKKMIQQIPTASF